MDIMPILSKLLEVSPFAGLLLYLLFRSEKRLDEKEVKYEARLDAKDTAVKEVTDNYHKSQAQHTAVLQELATVIKDRKK
ncbi:hypothetical protein [Emticicia sp. W12TSBA100-4]|uniref:hypothetical protein n=1 Tax=Emticicia sp. W12TSBA100-4 TaxID=3160965 RepID=UPI0033063C34